ncbi:efflux RND transporter periplasmic adaptor subunit [Opitutales bacterium ASA1]|uniref:efflux RND transporter periplasmic adaptor subunit n=1 Tax=Congregicoccus parvus TaxID=3081749 RepID=UPI002B28B7D1|nr:efflux RND transporter periplasmic adaptor subunit [Opitutales bacterium ASA1]
MNRRLVTLALALTGLFLGGAAVFLVPEHTLFPPHAAVADSNTGERWACPMMDFIAKKPGDCPVCGMEMGLVTAGELTREQRRRMGLRTTRVAEGPARVVVRAYGTVRWDDRTLRAVVPQVAGRIVKRHDAARHVGTLVARGDPIVDLYSPELYAAQGELAAAVRLGDTPGVRALRARFERWNLADVAQAIVDGSEPVDTVTITSPFDGLVVLELPGVDDAMDVRLPQVGREIMPDTTLLRLVDPSAYMVVLQVPESRAAWVRTGQRARIATDDLGALPDLTAEVAWLSPRLDPMLRTREAHLHLADPGGRLLAGSLVEARIEALLGPDLRPLSPEDGEAEAAAFVLVPKTAVLSTGVRHVAWRLAERGSEGRMRFEPVPLALGPRLEDEGGNDLYVVRAGLRAGDEVATQGAFLIDSQSQLAGTPSLLFPLGATAPMSGEPASGGAHRH